MSRRALLGGAAGLPLVPEALAPSFRRKPESTLPASAERRWTPDQVRGDDEWLEALAKLHSAEAEMQAFERATAGSSAEEEEVWLPVYEARLDSFGGAVRGVMLAAAPDFAAFASKLELFFEHELEPNSVGENVLAAIRGDARRLAGSG